MGGGGVVGWVAGWGSVVVVWVGFVGELAAADFEPEKRNQKITAHIETLSVWQKLPSLQVYRYRYICICKFTKEITYS